MQRGGKIMREEKEERKARDEAKKIHKMVVMEGTRREESMRSSACKP